MPVSSPTTTPGSRACHPPSRRVTSVLPWEGADRPPARPPWPAAVLGDVRLHGGGPRALSAQNQLHALAQRPLPAPSPGNEVGDLRHLAGGVGDRDGEARPLEGGDIEQVVADVGAGVERNAELGAQVLEHLAFAPGLQNHGVHPELVSPGLGHGALLARHEGRSQPASVRQSHRHSVAAVEELELIAPLAEHHAAVRQHAIDVRDQEPDPPRSPRDDAPGRHAMRVNCRAGVALAGTAASPGRLTTTAAKNQKACVLLTLMKVSAPAACTRRPIVPATKPSASPRSSGSRSVRNDPRPALSADHASQRKTASPTMPVSTRVRAYCTSMSSVAVTP